MSGESILGRAISYIGSGRCKGYRCLVEVNTEGTRLEPRLFQGTNVGRDSDLQEEVPCYADVRELGGWCRTTWNPPLDLFPLEVRQIEAEGGSEILVVPNWPSQAWLGLLRGLASRLLEPNPGNDGKPLL